MFELFCQWNRGFSPSYLPNDQVLRDLVNDKIRSAADLLNFVYMNTEEYFSLNWLLNALWVKLVESLPALQWVL
jgi:hypothetical protein